VRSTQNDSNTFKKTAYLVKAKGFIALTKPRIIELLLVTTLPAMFLAAKGVPKITEIISTLIGGTLAAGGANTLNMVIDADIDKVMSRTKNRPLVTGVINKNEAIIFAILLEVIAFLTLYSFDNLLSAILAESAMAFYVLIYTMWLKRRNTQNIVIGGAAGAVPPLVGWASVTGHVGLPAVLMALIIFLWTPPHFWALAIKYRDDYTRARVPMMPAVKTISHTAKNIVFYSFLVAIVTLAMFFASHLGVFYLIISTFASALLIIYSILLMSKPIPSRAMTVFKYSIIYVVIVFGAILVSSLITK
jgi:protoheme IX farnesyltransferase